MGGEGELVLSQETHTQLRAGERFAHEAAFYRGLDGMVETVAPFVRQGVENGESILVALLPDRIKALRAALGDDASRVEFVNMAELGGNPARIIPEWRRFVAEADPTRPLRGVGEPIWAGRRAVEIDECRLHESLLNVAFDDGPPWQLMCPYDADALPDYVIDDAMRTHPIASGPTGHASYEGHQHAIEEFGAPLAGPPSSADEFTFGFEDLGGLRGIVARMAIHAGLDHDRADDLVLAAHELATNSVTHGGGHGRMSLWLDSEALVVDVRDAGVNGDPLVGRDLDLSLAEHGRGVWMANQLCDLVQVRSTPRGTVVRLYAWR